MRHQQNNEEDPWEGDVLGDREEAIRGKDLPPWKLEKDLRVTSQVLVSLERHDPTCPVFMFFRL